MGVLRNLVIEMFKTTLNIFKNEPFARDFFLHNCLEGLQSCSSVQIFLKPTILVGDIFVVACYV